MCTLQLCVFADRVMRMKPLIMFKGSGKKTAPLKKEYKQYHPSVVVVFNPKAYANTSNLINQVKNQYSIASKYPL